MQVFQYLKLNENILFDRLVDLSGQVLTENQDVNEILYGKAGYLYSLLLLYAKNVSLWRNNVISMFICLENMFYKFTVDMILMLIFSFSCSMCMFDFLYDIFFTYFAELWFYFLNIYIFFSKMTGM